MRSRARIILLATILVMTILGMQPAQATQAPLSVPEIQVALSTVETEVWEGNRMVWQVSLKNIGDNLLTDVTLSTMDPWYWPGGPLVIGTIAAGEEHVVAIPTVAMEDGEMVPSLLAEWKVEQTFHSILMTAATPLKVRPMREAIEGQVLLEKGTVHPGDDLPLSVWLANRSPFLLTGVTVTVRGTDLDWKDSTGGEDMATGETSLVSLSPRVTGNHPQAILAVEFQWTNAAGETPHERVLLTGEPVQATPSIPVDIPWSAVTAVAGFLLGWLGWWVQHRQEREEARRVDGQRTLGILSLIQVQAQRAADECTEASLDLVQKLFSEEGLYAAMERLEDREAGLITCVHAVWHAAYGHNVGIHHPDGAPRTEVLRRKAQELDLLLRRLRSDESW